MNNSASKYPKSTELPTLINKPTTNKAQIPTEDFEFTTEITTTTTNKIKTEENKATSGISVRKTDSSTTEEPTKSINNSDDLDIQNSITKKSSTTTTVTDKVQKASQTKTVKTSNEKNTKNVGIDSDLDIQNEIRKNSSVVSTTSKNVEKTPQASEETTVKGLDVNKNRVQDTKEDLSQAKFSGKIIVLIVTLLVVCLCCCYFYLWKYSKLQLPPNKHKSDYSCTKAKVGYKSETEKLHCNVSNVVSNV